MPCFVALLAIRFPIYIVASCVATVLWFVRGFPSIPWAAGLVGAVTVGCTVMLAKGPSQRLNQVAAIVLMFALDGLLIAGIVKMGFVPAFVAWGIAHLVGIPVSALLVFVSSGLAELGQDDDACAHWILTRGFVFGVASIVGVIAFAGV
jgi:hypothetical protein